MSVNTLVDLDIVWTLVGISTLKFPCSIRFIADYKDFIISGRFVQADDGLVINDVAISDAGIYSCLATNEAGSASGIGHLVVKG